MEPVYLEDIEPGGSFVSSRRTLTEADIVSFSGISGDYSPLHSDERFVREHTPFEGRIAQGWLVVTIQSGLRSELDRWRILAYVSMERRFREPAYPGDTLQARYRVVEVRPSSSKPDRGIVRLECEVLKQAGALVQSGADSFMVASRPQS